MANEANDCTFKLIEDWLFAEQPTTERIDMDFFDEYADVHFVDGGIMMDGIFVSDNEDLDDFEWVDDHWYEEFPSAG